MNFDPEWRVTVQLSKDFEFEKVREVISEVHSDLAVTGGRGHDSPVPKMTDVEKWYPKHLGFMWLQAMIYL